MQQSAVAVISPYWDFWEDSVDDVDLRVERSQILDDLTRRLTDEGYRVTGAHLIDAPTTRPAWRASIEAADIVLVVVSMACPPSHVIDLLTATTRPVVIWTVNLALTPHGALSTIVRDGGTVGTPQLTSALLRLERPFSHVAGSPEDSRTHHRRRALLEAELLAVDGSLTLGRIGEPLPGYLSVDASDDELERTLALRVDRANPDLLASLARNVPRERINALVAEQMARHASGEPTDSVSLERSCRWALALQELVTDRGWDAGTINCHVPAVRFDPEIGVAPCLALGLSTSDGVPFTCTGDVLTSVAMLVGRRLAGAALYHEIESVDPASGLAILANTGEHDAAWCPTGWQPELRDNPWFRGDPQAGTISWFPLPAGEATIVAFVPAPGATGGVRFVTARGHLVDDDVSAPTVGGGFRFADQSPLRAWERWVMAGVNHHSACVPGDITEAVDVLATRLGADHINIC